MGVRVSPKESKRKVPPSLPYIIYDGPVRIGVNGAVRIEQCGNDPGPPRLSYLTGTDLDYDILSDERGY